MNNNTELFIQIPVLHEIDTSPHRLFHEKAVTLHPKKK